MSQLFGIVALVLVSTALGACRGGKVAGLDTSGSGTLRVKKKSTKEAQIEAIKAEMAREGVAAEKVASVQESLAGVLDVDDPAEQARLLLVKLTEALAASGTDERLKEQMARVVMGAAAELGLSLERSGVATDDTPVRQSLLETAAAGLVAQNVAAATLVSAASRQLLEEPQATVESVSALLVGLPAVAGVPEEEVSQLVTVEKEKQEAQTRSCLEPSRVSSGVEYHCPDGSARVGTLPVCSQDAEVGCVTTDAFKPTAVATLPSRVLLGQTVAGEPGAVRLPDAADVRAGVGFGALNAVSGALVLPSPSAVVAGTVYGASSSMTGTFTPDFPDPSNVRPPDTTNGVLGTYVPDFPDASNVRITDTVNGSAGTLGDCSVDGDEGCVVPLSVAIKAADTARITEWDIRRKRAQDGTLITFAGLSGRNKTCRNRANLATGPDGTNSSDTDLPFNNTTSPASSSLVPDFFDTIDDWNNGLTGLPTDAVPWTIFGVSGTHARDFLCGGIYATGGKDYSDGSPTKTGADGTLDHDPDGNWQDLTPGIVPGGFNSLNTNPGCNSSDKFCVFRELISGLMVTEVSAVTYTWQAAIDYCHTLGEAGGAVANPIPVLAVGLGTSHSDWRLPTQKELTHLSTAGIRGLNQTADLVSFFGSVDDGFWSASSLSGNTANAWNGYLYYGFIVNSSKGDPNRVLCVR